MCSRSQAAWTFHTISWGLVGLDLLGFLGPVHLVRGMQQVRSLCARFSYRWDAYEHWSVLAIGVTHWELEALDYRG
jgi:hypothetical protein